MAYKEKTCPRCGAIHNKRGEYCSRSCGNQKPHTAETRAKLSETQREWRTSGDENAEVAVHNFISKGLHKSADPIAPPVRPPVRDNQFVQDGDLWEEC